MTDETLFDLGQYPQPSVAQGTIASAATELPSTTDVAPDSGVVPHAVVTPRTSTAAAEKHQMTLLAIQEKMMARGNDRGNIGFTTPLWAQFALPHRDPGDVPFWSTQNRGLDLVITPGSRLDEGGSRVTAGYPWGRVPRAMLTFMATQAVLTESPVIELGEGRREFFRRVGIARAGAKREKQVFHLIEALAAADVKVEETEKGSSGSWGYRWRRMSFVDGLQLWLNEEKDPGAPLWGSTVRLSDDFFETIVKAPMPLLLEDLKLLGSSTLAHDIYLWLTYRMHQLSRSQTITYEQLYAQFGAGHSHMRNFRIAFRKSLDRVLKVYTDANVSVDLDKPYIRLHPSKPRVPSTRALKAI